VEKWHGTEHQGAIAPLVKLAQLYSYQARLSDAEQHYRRALGIAANTFGRDHSAVGWVLCGLGNLYGLQGRYAEAEETLRYALGIAEKTFGLDDLQAETTLGELGGLYTLQGRYAEAESFYRRALSIDEKVLGPEHDATADSLNRLAVMYSYQGRYDEAEPLFRRSLSVWEKRYGSESLQAAMLYGNLAGMYQDQGHLTEAELFERRSLEIRERVLGPDHLDVANEVSGLAGVYRKQGRLAEAARLYGRALGVRERALGPTHPTVGRTLNNLADVSRERGFIAEAEQLYRRALVIREQALGSEHPDVAQSLNGLAIVLRMQGRSDEALVLARRATAVLARRFTVNPGGSRHGVFAEQRKSAGEFTLHMALLAEVAEHNAEAGGEVARENFWIAQLARASNTADQVGKMAARYASGSDTLAQLARARQDALAKFEQLDTRIVQTAGQPANEKLLMALQAEQQGFVKTIAELDGRLDREFPMYRELTSAKPLELAAAHQLLNDDEALLLFLFAGEESYLWALRRTTGGFFKLNVKVHELAATVKALRSQLDLGIEDPETMLKRPFDIAKSHSLYRQLLGPAETLLAGARHLILVPDGGLQSLPLAVLVTELTSEVETFPEDYVKVAWLAKKYTITVLPAAASLRALRQFAKPPAARESFGAFGDPVLEGNGEGTRRLNAAALTSRGAVADVNEVRKLPRLPETAYELRAIATQLKAPAESIRLGPAATERAVKEADLARYRNIAFATHGLMAGDFTGLAEPALVLTPPTQGSELDDGLLTAGEISQLKLDADWVVLSACNTAAPDGTPGAEGLSGLASAFFYAGARSLLVSHWSVSSQAATALTTRMFEEAAKGASKAEALRRSMLALMNRQDNPYFAHPALWAPFVVVGEGNAEWAARH
jgi:CHAT domain-containing protein/Tfp pilus assembly protein PilF